MKHISTQRTFGADALIRHWWILVSVVVGMAGMKIQKEVSWGPEPESAASVPSANNSSLLRMESAWIFDDLVKTHPHKEIRENLSRLIASGEIVINDRRAPVQNLLRLGIAARYLETPSGHVMALVVSPDAFLKNPRLTKEMKQLKIYHEWIHMKQQREGFFPTRHLQPRDPYEPISEEEMRIIFESEVEAYLEECRLAMRMNVPMELDVCRAYINSGLTEMRLEVIKDYALTLQYLPHLGFLTDVAFEKNRDMLRQ